HTSPNSTADNVFLEIKPSPRSESDARVPVVTSDLVSGPFKDFFDKCEVELAVNDKPIEWPRFWDDLPQTLQDLEKGLLEKYAPDLWKKNETAIKQGAWPQYYLGNYPYCFRLPKYTSSTWPPASKAVETSAHTAGAGSIEHDEAAQPTRPLIMGQSPGTHWYHAHKHGSTTINVLNGMTGLFVIQDNSPTGYDGFIANAYRAYPNFKQQVMVVNQLGTTPKLERGGPGAPGPHFAVNGRIQPKITMTGGEVQLWRVANNASRGGVFILGPAANGLSWKQTAQDGVQLADSNYQPDLNQPMLLAAGNRADLLVKAPMLPAGQKSASYALVVENTVDPSDRAPAKPNAATETLLTVQVNANGPDMPFMATAAPMPPFLTDVTDEEVRGKTKRLVFASGAPGTADQHTIDGKLFDGEVGASVLLNEAEEWTIVNATYASNGNQISHPFHIHINPFQIVDVFDPNEALSSAKGAGTVTTTAKSGVVTGTGTTFTTSVHVGDFIWINGEKPATVLSIQSDTALTFNLAAKGVTAATYTIAVPLYTINATTAQAGQCVINPTDEATFKNCHMPARPEHLLWWDVFSIPSGNTFYNTAGTGVQVPGHFKMRSRFVDYAGFFVLHCHMLAHEDRGMMTVVEVTPLQPPYSHH
ncbi:MAG: multicopper oxidase family protein, partial [Thermoanaerobaculia bacterium]